MQNAEAFEEYLRRVADLARQLSQQSSDSTPSELDTPGKRALWSNLNSNLDLAIRIDSTVRQVRAPCARYGLMAGEGCRPRRN